MKVKVTLTPEDAVIVMKMYEAGEFANLGVTSAMMGEMAQEESIGDASTADSKQPKENVFSRIYFRIKLWLKSNPLIKKQSPKAGHTIDHSEFIRRMNYRYYVGKLFPIMNIHDALVTAVHSHGVQVLLTTKADSKIQIVGFIHPDDWYPSDQRMDLVKHVLPGATITVRIISLSSGGTHADVERVYLERTL